jgi:hypothetical protein
MTIRKILICEHPHCNHRARKHRLCATHGAQCAHPGCDKAIRKGGLCKTHGALCAHEGCDNGVSQDGMCSTHGKRCDRPGCDNAVRLDGMCATHRKRCVHPGCENAVRRGGSCATHGECCAYPGCDSFMKVGGVCSAHMKPSAVVEILKLRITVGCETFCPHLGSHFLWGNIHQGTIISQQNAASLPMFRRKQVPSLAYDEFKDGFRPRQWRFHINRDEDKYLCLLPDDYFHCFVQYLKTCVIT